MTTERHDKGKDADPGGSDRASELGPRLRAIRLRQGIGLRELARRLDLSPSSISQIETGKIRPSVSTLYALAAVMLAGPTLTGNALTYNGLMEALDVPVVPILILGTLAGTIGGGIGRGLSALSSGPRFSSRT